MLALLDERHGGFDRVLHDTVHVDGVQGQANAAADDARDLQEVAHQLGEVGDLALDDLAGLLLDEVLAAALVQFQYGILILDANTGKILDADAFMSGLLGLEAHDLLGKELFEIGLFQDIQENKEAFRELQRTGYLRHDHLPVQNQRGETVEVEFVSNVYREDHRLVAQCNVRDISERNRMEKKIKQQAEALADESRRKDEFLAMLSHELRNPLAPIRSAVHLLGGLEQAAVADLRVA